MNNLAIRLLLFGAVLGISRAQPVPSASGHWEGVIRIPDHSFEVTVDLAKRPGGEWIGSMSVLGSTSIDVPLAALVVDNTVVRFTANLPEQAAFEGRLSAENGSISGTASNLEGEAPFGLTRKGDPSVKVPARSSPLSNEFAGTWEGVLGAGKRVAISLVPAPDGTAVGTLIAIDQGNMKIPVTTVTIHDRQLELESRAVSGSYRGTLTPGGELSGEWSEAGNHIPLTLKRAAARP